MALSNLAALITLACLINRNDVDCQTTLTMHTHWMVQAGDGVGVVGAGHHLIARQQVYVYVHAVRMWF